MSRGYTRAQKSLADNYTAGSVVGFHRAYKRLGVEQGDELKVHNIDRSAGTVNLIGNDGELVNWDPGKLAARTGGVEVYRADLFELRQGDRIRWTKNDAAYGLVNSQTAEVTGVKDGTVSFKLEDGRTLDLKKGDPQLTSTSWTGELIAHGIRISMDGKGRWINNMFIERLWRSLKYECVYLRAFADFREARDGIGAWVSYYASTNLKV